MERWKLGTFGAILGELIVQDYIDQRFLNPDAAVVTDKPELAKAIHEEADAGPGGADHLCQSLLRDGRNEGFRLPRLPKLRHQQENPCQTLLAGVEQLIDQIGLGPHAAGQQELQEDVGEGWFIMHHADHLLPRYLERCTDDNGRGSGHMQPPHARQRLVPNEFPGGEKRDRGLFALRRNDCELCAASPKIEDGVSRISLRKEDLLGLQMDDFSSCSRFFQKGGEVKGHVSHFRHANGPSRMRSSREQFGGVRGRFRFEVTDFHLGCPTVQNDTPSARVGAVFENLLQIDVSATVLRDSRAWDTEGKWSTPRSGRSGRGIRVSTGWRIGLFGLGCFSWRPVL